MQIINLCNEKLMKIREECKKENWKKEELPIKIKEELYQLLKEQNE